MKIDLLDSHCSQFLH